jgi:hypothetical protein
MTAEMCLKAVEWLAMGIFGVLVLGFVLWRVVWFLNAF